MESKINNKISIDIPNYSGPLETLLDLAKNQKVDLTKISVTTLADHFLDCLLYTSPSPRDRTRSRMPSSA